MEMIVTLFGMCLTFVPVIVFVRYLLNSVTEKREFNYHLDLVNDKKGKKGIFIAYATKISLSIMVTSLGIYLASFFDNSLFLDLFIISLILFVLLYYFDVNNEK